MEFHNVGMTEVYWNLLSPWSPFCRQPKPYHSILLRIDSHLSELMQQLNIFTCYFSCCGVFSSLCLNSLAFQNLGSRMRLHNNYICFQQLLFSCVYHHLFPIKITMEIIFRFGSFFLTPTHKILNIAPKTQADTKNMYIKIYIYIYRN